MIQRGLRLVVLCGLALLSRGDVHAQDRGSQPAWGSVATFVRNGQPNEASQALERMPRTDRDSATGRYLSARLAEMRGRHADVVAALQGDFHELPEEVRADVARRRTRALAQTDQCDQAQSALEGARGVGPDLHAAIAECALRRGNLELAMRAATRAVDGARPRAAVPYRILRADVRLRRGDRAQAIAELTEVLRTYPAHRKASDALDRLTSLSAVPRWSARERLERAEAFSEARQHGRAIEELRGLSAPRSPRADRARFLHVHGMALFGTRHSYDDAARVLAEAARIPSATSASDAFHAARALARSGHEAAAVTAYQRFVRDHADDSHAAEAAYLAATSQLRRGESSGVRAMNQFLRGPYAERAPDSAREGRSELAFYEFNRRQYQDAARAFLAYAQLGTSGMVRGRGYYWAGRAQMLANQRTEGIASYRQAILAEPLHWYGQLARAQLVALGVDPGAPFPATPAAAAPAALALQLPDAAAFYSQLGLVEDAREIVRANEDRIRARAPRGREVEMLVAVYASIDDADRTYHLTAGMREALSQPYASANAWVWNAAYPRPWQAIVDREAASRRVPEDYLYAIMRQESGYDPSVVSSADAIGLLQLLPSTAARVGEGINERVDRQDLFRPATNIRISAVYTGNLYRTFVQQAPLSIGAYNAGAPRMQRWLESTDTEELDLFVERISVEQTRNYIRRVMSHWARYRYMRNPSAGWPTLFSLRLDRTHVDRQQAAADR